MIPVWSCLAISSLQEHLNAASAPWLGTVRHLPASSPLQAAYVDCIASIAETPTKSFIPELIAKQFTLNYFVETYDPNYREFVP